MERESLECLVALGRERDWARAAERCGVAEERLNQVVSAAEEEYGHAIVVPGQPFRGFTPEGERLLAWANDFCTAFEQLAQCFATSRRRTLVAPLLERRSVSPKRLRAPGPCAHDMALVAQAGLHAPDHGGLHPWRLLEFAQDQRALLADRFEAEKLRRDHWPPPPTCSAPASMPCARRCCWPSSSRPRRVRKCRCANSGCRQGRPWATCSTLRTNWVLAPSC